MSPEEAAVKSTAVLRQLEALPEIQSAPTVLTYISSKDNEVDTRGFIASLLYQKKTALVPIALENRIMAWSELHNLSEAVPGKFGILEPLPQYRRIVDPSDDAPVLVPGIAFTKRGARIGYGGGYFDTFLADFPGPKIGLAFDCQILRNFPVDEHDVPVDLVVTESALFRCG